MNYIDHAVSFFLYKILKRETLWSAQYLKIFFLNYACNSNFFFCKLCIRFAGFDYFRSINR